jgi:hypothetical protein
VAVGYGYQEADDDDFSILHGPARGAEPAFVFLSVSPSSSFFVWHFIRARRALNSENRRVPARAVDPLSAGTPWRSLPPMGQPRADAAGCASHGRWCHHAPTSIGARSIAAMVVYNIFERVPIGVGA